MKKGEIWLFELPYSNSSEQAGMRPALIMTTTTVGIVMVIPLTSNVQALRFPFTFLIKKSEENGLSIDSIALVFHLRAIDTKRCKKKLGELELKHIQNIKKTISRFLDL